MVQEEVDLPLRHFNVWHNWILNILFKHFTNYISLEQCLERKISKIPETLRFFQFYLSNQGRHRSILCMVKPVKSLTPRSNLAKYWSNFTSSINGWPKLKSREQQDQRNIYTPIEQCWIYQWYWCRENRWLIPSHHVQSVISMIMMDQHRDFTNQT